MIWKIRTGSAVILRQTARPVDYHADHPRRLARHLWDTLASAKGLGLAAPQIGKPLRMAVMAVNGFRATLINPVILDRQGQQRSPEGCLSRPGQTKIVVRAARIHLQWLDTDGQEHRQWLDGLSARCAQHEVDHLDGKLIC